MRRARHLRARRHQAGFSLIELVMVVAVIAVLGTIAVYSINRSRETATVERAASMLRQRIERSQALAAVAGSRMATGRITLAPPCPQINPPYLWVQINPGTNQVTFPAALAYDPNTDVMTVSCEVWNLGTVTNGFGTLEYPAAATSFAFTTDGRVLVQTGAGVVPGTLYVGVKHATQPRRFGLRLLSSGVICPSGRPAVVACDEDT